jgi:hypothetical protein
MGSRGPSGAQAAFIFGDWPPFRLHFQETGPLFESQRRRRRRLGRSEYEIKDAIVIAPVVVRVAVPD